MVESKKNTVNGLTQLLASSYLLYLKTQNFHWNVTGPNFMPHHLMFEAQYTDLAEAVDLLAERIRGLGEIAPGSFAEFLKLSVIKEADKLPKAEGMIKQLLSDHEAIIKLAKDVISTADDANDPGTADMLTSRLEVHEKTAWMLRSHLE